MTSSRILLAAILAVGAATTTPAHAGKPKVLYSFTGAADGSWPSPMVSDGVSLYGTTQRGANAGCAISQGCGAIFKFDPTSGSETTLYDFTGGTDGGTPAGYAGGPPILVGGVLYGTTNFGGATCTFPNGYCGTVYAFNLSSGILTTLQSFGAGNGGNGYAPNNVIYANGMLFGSLGQVNINDPVTDSGGLFEMQPGGSGFTLLYTFPRNSEGSSGEPLLQFAQDGLIYGVEPGGGSQGYGLIFTIDTATGAVAILHTFSSSEPDVPEGLAAGNGGIYGTTASGTGSIFQLNPTDGTITTLYATPTPNVDPSVQLSIDGAQLFSGASGGCAKPRNCGGTVFDFDLTSNTYSTLATFKSKGDYMDGQYPSGLLYQKRTLYGSTDFGGAQGKGVLFSVKP